MPLVFGDIAGSVGDDVLAAGCYLGREEDWAAAADEWRRALQDADVEYFHATSFYACRGQFRDWTMNDTKHVEFAKRFTSIATDAQLVGFAWAMDQTAFLEVLAPELEKEKRQHKSSHPRTYALMSALAAVNAFLTEVRYRELNAIRVAFEDEAGSGRFSSFLDESKTRREGWTRWFRDFNVVPKQFVPAQMADLLAHEAWRRGKEIMSENPRDVRKSFSRMLADGRLELRWQSRARCQEHAEQARDTLSRYPDGLVPPDGQ